MDKSTASPSLDSEYIRLPVMSASYPPDLLQQRLSAIRQIDEDGRGDNRGP